MKNSSEKILKSVLVTGAAGFVGQNLVKSLMEDYSVVVGFDRNRPQFIHATHDVQGDCSSLAGMKEVVRRCSKFDYIIHLAANTDTLYADDVGMYTQNLLPLLAVMRLAKLSRAKLIYASSSAIYGNGNGPLNAYAHSKLVGEEIIQFLKQNAIGLRFFNVFGMYEDHKGRMASVIHQWTKQLALGESIKLFREPEPVLRDFVYVKDVVGAIRYAMENELKAGSYDVGSGEPHSFVQVFETLKEWFRVNVIPEMVNNPHPATYQTLTKAKLDWGWTPAYDSGQGIQDFLKDKYKNYENFSRLR